MEFVISHLSKSYGKHQVLRDVDHAFEEGKIYGLLGRNGAGKTTLFNCLNSDMEVDAGSFYFREGDRTEPVNAEDIGYVLSTPTVPDFMTGREFLKFFMDIHAERIRDPKSIDQYMDFMMIPQDTRDRLMKDYSHGTRNKMQMLVNIIAGPRLMLLDEPLTSLDVVVAEEMKDILKSQKAGRVLIFSTHLLDIAVDVCDEIVLLNHGRLEAVDKADLNDDDFKTKIIEALKDAEVS
ncbi:MAG: ABC transporter ATP-binding protein [Lachnospiraceae bacterium]|nr:ABC transporter ATP-binding protein [Lachnospiraceae bacterium]